MADQEIPNRPLRCKIKQVMEVDFKEMDRFIARAFGLDKFCSWIESSNDTTHAYDGITNEPLPDYDQDDLKESIELKGCEYYKLGTILQELCHQGKIAPGNYMMRVCW